MLYSGSGAGTSDADTVVPGQKLEDLRGRVLRIDISDRTQEKSYVITPDKLFGDLTNARPELFVFVFFFFQAEDGIRVSPVTGVQTCALPICCSQSLPEGNDTELLPFSGRQMDCPQSPPRN